MSFRPSLLRVLATVLVPLAAACRDERPVRTTVSSSPATVAVADSNPVPAAGDSATAPITGPVSYADAEAAYASREYDQAVDLFAAYTRSRPDNAWGHYMYGLSSWKVGDPEQALASFDEALRLDPQHRKSLLNSARVLLETSRPHEALERIERAMTLEPLSSEGLRLLGRARYELKQVPEAIDAYQRAIALDDRDVWAMNNLGLIYIQQDRTEEALPPLARAVQLRANAPVFQNNLGMALERTGYTDAARHAYAAALEADSTYGKASASLTRLGGPPADPVTDSAQSVNLAQLAREFQAQVERWRDTTGTDSVVVETDSVVVDSVVVEPMARDTTTQ